MGHLLNRFPSLYSAAGQTGLVKIGYFPGMTTGERNRCPGRPSKGLQLSEPIFQV